MKRAPKEKPVTAAPIGAHFIVQTRGLHHTQKTFPPRRGLEDLSDNFFEHDDGCFRRVPTSED